MIQVNSDIENIRNEIAAKEIELNKYELVVDILKGDIKELQQKMFQLRNPNYDRGELVITDEMTLD